MKPETSLDLIHHEAGAWMMWDAFSTYIYDLWFF